MKRFQRSALNIASLKIPVAQMRFLCSPAKVRGLAWLRLAIKETYIVVGGTP